MAVIRSGVVFGNAAEEGDDETTTAKNIKPTLDATTEREPLRRRCKAVAEASAANDRS